MKYWTFSFLLLFLLGCSEEEAAPTPPQEDAAIRYLALGDSYTIGEGVAPSARFPVQLADSLQQRGYDVADPRIIATTGWTTTNLLNAIANANLQNQEFDLVSLLIGVNNQYQGRSLSVYRREFLDLLLKSIDLANGKKEQVFVVSIPDWGYTPFGQSGQAQISAEIDQFNAVNKHITDSLGVSYFNITPISRQGLADPSLVAADGLHPSAKMYALWVEQMADEVAKTLQD